MGESLDAFSFSAPWGMVEVRPHADDSVGWIPGVATFDGRAGHLVPLNICALLLHADLAHQRRKPYSTVLLAPSDFKRVRAQAASIVELQRAMDVTGRP